MCMVYGSLDDNEKWVQCSVCEAWWNFSCVLIEEESIAETMFVITVFNAYFVVWCSTCNLLVHIFGQFISAFNCEVPELQYVLVFFDS